MSILSFLDRPASYIGKRVPRPNAKRLLAGGGRYVDDLRLPRLVHLAFLRSPYAHARILAIDTAAASRAPGVVRVLTAKDLEGRYTPWVGVLTHFKGLKSPPQHPLARERATWQGEPIVAVAAESRALAEDAAALVKIEWQELPAVTDMAGALAPGAPPIHAELGDNLAFTRSVDAGEVDAAFAKAFAVVEEEYSFARHTGVCPEPRSILADYDQAGESLTVHYSNQAPHMMKEIFAKHFRLGGKRGARDLSRCRRLLRHQDSRLSRRHDRPWRRACCWAGRSNSSPTGSNPSSPTSMRASTGSRRGSP